MQRTLGTAISTLITATLAIGPARSQEVTIHVAGSALSASAAATMTDARKALSAYIAACGAHDAEGVAHTTTGDAEIEFATDEPGRYLAVDLSALECCWSNSPADVWIYPTPAADTVFVNFVEGTNVGPNGHKQQHLALVKISAGRISQIRDFSTPLPRTALVDNGQGSAASGK